MDPEVPTQLQMSVLVIAAHEGQGSVHLDKLLPALERMGLDVEYFGWDRRRTLSRAFVRDGIRFRMIFRGWGYASRRLLFATPLWMSTVFWRVIRSRQNLVMAIDFDTGLPVAVVSRLTGQRYIYNVRDNYALRWWVPERLRPLINGLDNFIMSGAESVIVPDESRIPDSRPDSANFVVIRNCALDITGSNFTSSSGQPFTVCCIGYLRESRGVAMLLDALDQLPDVRVVAAGDCPEPELLQRLTSHPRVDYRGVLPVEEALELCCSADAVFTFYSPNAEINVRAVSNKWSDAMMARKPIIVNSEVLKSRWILAEDIGYACPYEVDALVGTLARIRSDPEEAARKGENGRRLYESGYNWAAMEVRLRNELLRVKERVRSGPKRTHRLGRRSGQPGRAA